MDHLSAITAKWFWKSRSRSPQSKLAQLRQSLTGATSLANTPSDSPHRSSREVGPHPYVVHRQHGIDNPLVFMGYPPIADIRIISAHGERLFQLSNTTKLLVKWD